MLLRVGDRIGLQSVLPSRGSFDTLRIVRDLQSALSFSEEELKRLDITRNGELFKWDGKVDSPVDIPIGEKATDVIKAALVELDSRRQLQAGLLSLYEHFVLDKAWKEEE